MSQVESSVCLQCHESFPNLELNKIPHHLLCNHVLCSKCCIQQINNIKQNVNENDNISNCFVCSMSISCKEDVGQVQTKDTLNVDKSKGKHHVIEPLPPIKIETEDFIIKCENLEFDCARNAVIYCSTCESSFCDPCSNVLHNAHQHAAISYKLHDLKPLNNRVPKCVHHPTCNVDYYCQKDKEMYCLKCYLCGKHKKHGDNIDISKYATNVRLKQEKQKISMLQLQQELQQELRKELENISTDVQSLQLSTLSSINDIDVTFDNIIKNVLERKEQLKQQVHEIEQSKLYRLSQRQELVVEAHIKSEFLMNSIQKAKKEEVSDVNLFLSDFSGGEGKQQQQQEILQQQQQEQGVDSISLSLVTLQCEEALLSPLKENFLIQLNQSSLAGLKTQISTFGSVDIPDCPSNVRVSFHEESFAIHVSWDIVHFQSHVNYQVAMKCYSLSLLKDDGSDTQQIEKVPFEHLFSGGSSEYILTSDKIKLNHRYHFKVRAESSVGYSDWSMDTSFSSSFQPSSSSSSSSSLSSPPPSSLSSTPSSSLATSLLWVETPMKGPHWFIPLNSKILLKQSYIHGPNILKLFNLNDDNHDEIHHCIDKIKLSLIYSGSRDGFNAQTFHKQCDHIIKTLVIIQSHSGHISGGYTTNPWSGQHEYLKKKKKNKNTPRTVNSNSKSNNDDGADDMSWLCSLYPSYCKFLCKSGKPYQSCDPEYGPIFGHHPNVKFQNVETSSSSDNDDDDVCCSNTFGIKTNNNVVSSLNTSINVDNNISSNDDISLPPAHDGDFSDFIHKTGLNAVVDKFFNHSDKNMSIHDDKEVEINKDDELKGCSIIQNEQMKKKKFGQDICISSSMISSTNISCLNSYTALAQSHNNQHSNLDTLKSDDDIDTIHNDEFQTNEKRSLFGTEHFAVADIEVFEVTLS